MTDGSTPDCEGVDSRTIIVREYGEYVGRIADHDVDAIQAAGRGDAGALFPPAKTNRKRPLLTATRMGDGRVKIAAGAVAGFVPLPSGRILRIDSKIGSKQGVLWLLFHALKLDASLLKRLLALPAERDNVLEWLLELLRLEVRRLVQAGLRKDYVPIEETSGYVRGRILPSRTIAETRGLAHQVTCLYDDFTADIFDNQVLRLALRAGAAVSTDLRHALLGTDALFDGEVSFEKSDLRQAANQLKRQLDQQHPGRRSYIPAHTLAYTVLRLLSAGGDGRAWRQPGILLDMPKLFEEALRQMLSGKRQRLSIRFESPDKSIVLDAPMETDISLPDLIVDAKYKAPFVPSRNGGTLVPRNSDLFQAYTYSGLGGQSCALVYAVGKDTPGRELLVSELRQVNANQPPRVGLFGLDVSGDSLDHLNPARDQLIAQLDDFIAGGV